MWFECKQAGSLGRPPAYIAPPNKGFDMICPQCLCYCMLCDYGFEVFCRQEPLVLYIVRLLGV
jgi:hypothetical protein